MHTMRVLVILLTLGVLASARDTEQLTKDFKEGYEIFLKTGLRTDKFHSIVSQHALSNEMRNGNSDETTQWLFNQVLGLLDILGLSSCDRCRLAAGNVLRAYQTNKVPAETIQYVVVLLCTVFKQYSGRVCDGFVKLQMPSIEYILRHGKNITVNRVCGILFQADNNCEKDDSLDWSIDLGDEYKKENVPKTPNSPAKAGPLNILQLTDIHFDPNYRVGGNADCGEPLCCRSDPGTHAVKPQAAAGRWGDYRKCDISFEVVTDALAHIKKQHQQIDYVYMTGDLVSHAVWATSKEENNATFIKILNELKRSFGDTPIFPVVGNHEIHPLNVYAPVKITEESVSSAWLYETLSDLWSVWLPADTKETILKGGYYTVLVKPGFRVVVLNNNQCYVYNWWLIYDDKDPDNQLQWLVGVLRQAEIDGEKVHMLYHIPTGSSDCYKRWSREYNKIINRFEKTVMAQFSGHTHHDEFQIFYSNKDPTRAINVLYNGGSLTSYNDVNSNYRLYSVDANTLDVLDHETWIFNLTASNLSPANTLTWEKMYSFREAYGVDSLSPNDMHKLAQRMAKDKNLLQQYFRFNNLLGDPMLKKGCDEECLKKLLCEVVTSDSSKLSRCDERLRTVFERNI